MSLEFYSCIIYIHRNINLGLHHWFMHVPVPASASQPFTITEQLIEMIAGQSHSCSCPAVYQEMYNLYPNVVFIPRNVYFISRSVIYLPLTFLSTLDFDMLTPVSVTLSQATFLFFVKHVKELIYFIFSFIKGVYLFRITNKYHI